VSGHVDGVREVVALRDGVTGPCDLRAPESCWCSLAQGRSRDMDVADLNEGRRL